MKIQIIEYFLLGIGQLLVVVDSQFIEENLILFVFTIVIFAIAIPSCLLIFKMIYIMDTKIKYQALKIYQDLKTSNLI